MSTPPEDRLPPLTDQENPLQQRPLRLQFSTRQLLVIVLLASIGCGIVFGFPDWLASALAISGSILVAAILVVGIVGSKGDARAFCIGAIFPTGVAGLAAGGFYIFLIFLHARAGFGPTGSSLLLETLEEFSGSWRFAIGTAWPLALVTGALSVVVQRRLARPPNVE